jgi:hypothetical protein
MRYYHYDDGGNVVSVGNGVLSTPEILRHPIRQVARAGGFTTFLIVVADSADVADVMPLKLRSVKGASLGYVTMSL